MQHSTVKLPKPAAQAACVGALLCMACAQSAMAQQSALYDKVQLNGVAIKTGLRITQSQGEPLATAGPASTQDSLNGRDSATSRQTMMWAVHPSGVGVGLGVEQRGAYEAGGVLMGVSMATSERSHLVVQTPLVSNRPPQVGPVQTDPQLLQDEQHQVRVGLVFNTANRYSDLRKGLRMELSNQTTFTVKPRGGGRIGFSLQKSW